MIGEVFRFRESQPIYIHPFPDVHMTLDYNYTNLNVNIHPTVVFDFFDFSNIFPPLPDDCCNNASWNPGLQINIHAIE